MFCKRCKWFTGYGPLSLSEVSVDLNRESGVVTVSGRLLMPCAECKRGIKCITLNETWNASLLMKPKEVVRKDICFDRIATERYGKLLTDKWYAENMQTIYTMSNLKIEGTELESGNWLRKFRDGSIREIPVHQRRHTKTIRGLVVTGRVDMILRWSDVLHPGETLEQEDYEVFRIQKEAGMAHWEDC